MLNRTHPGLLNSFSGSRRVVILNSYDVIKEAFVKYGNHFSDRPPIYIVKVLTEGLGECEKPYYIVFDKHMHRYNN